MGKYLSLILSLGSLGMLAKGEEVHLVRRGETLSEIAQKLSPDRVYGKKGTLRKLILSNPSVSHPDRIRPGQTLQIGVLTREKNRPAEGPKVLSDEEAELPSPQLKLRELGLSAWISSRVSAISYAQTTTTATGEGNFSEFGYTGWSAGARLRVNDSFDGQVEFVDLRGRIDSGETESLSNSTYSWWTLRTELQKPLIRGLQDKFYLSLGAQVQRIPILEESSDQRVVLRYHQLRSASFGGGFVFTHTADYVSEGEIRYHQLLGTDDATAFAAKSRLIVDAKIGTARRLTERFRIGAHWVIQYNDINYKSSDDQIRSAGNLKLKSSALELRATLVF